MACSALLGLFYESDAGVCDRGADLVSLVADYHYDVARGNQLACRSDDMQQERLAADLMENLGPLRFKARAFARGHNNDHRGRLRYSLCAFHFFTHSC